VGRWHILGLTVGLICWASIAHAQNAPLDWPSELTSDDRRDVLALAKQMGIDDPVSVQLSLLMFGHRNLSVESRPGELGLEVHSIRAVMFRDDWLGYQNDPPVGAGPYQVGRWTSIGRPEALIRWRIYDGDWFTDVQLGSPDAYDDGRMIVMAFRQRTLVNRQPEQVENGVRSQPPIPRIDLPRVGAISRPPDLIFSRDPTRTREYVVLWGSMGYNSDSLHVRIVNDRVEFLGVIHSIV
jgi:hypothetical protein